MRDTIDDVFRALSLAQGAAFILGTVGGGTIVAGVAGGVLATYSALPGWSIGLSTVGAFLVTVAALSVLLKRLRPASTTITATLQEGGRLRKSLAGDPTTEPTEAHTTAWQLRIDDWVAEARDVVARVAPDRLGGFDLDVLVVDHVVGEEANWQRRLLTQLDTKIDRLSNIRASL